VFFLFLIAASVFLLPLSAHAIPSPDLVINLFASSTQIIGLLAVIAGGLFVRRGKSKKKTSGSPALAITLGLLLFVAIGGNVAQYARHKDQTSDRLRTNLWKSSKEQGQAVGDVNLKELSYSEQIKHPLGYTTEEVNKKIAAGEQLNLIDVRETEEVEMKAIPGTWHVRYPDIQAKPVNLEIPGKETIFLCESGNRSSELCNYFTAKGAKCKFMVGGYEKWDAESRPIEVKKTNTTGDLRALPDYANRDVLLDTPEVMDIYKKRNPVFVDVRYPGDFEKDHMPDAINVTLRALTSDKMTEALSSIPKRPVIAPCYDKRSCFYATVLGLKLTRMGYEYLGRYSVPAEFAKPQKDKEFVSKWKEDQAEQTPIGMAKNKILALLVKAKSTFGGGAILAILAVSLLFRVLMIPVSLYLEKMNYVKAQYNAIPGISEKTSAQKQSELNELYEKHGLSNLVSFLLSMGQLFVFYVVFQAVSKFAKENANVVLSHFGSINEKTTLPVLAVISSTVILAFVRVNNPKQKWAISAAITIAFGILLAMLPTGQNLYVLASLLFVLALNRTYVAVKNRQVKTNEMYKQMGIFELKELQDSSGFGNKAKNLSIMLKLGLNVPNGFCLSQEFLKNLKDGKLPEAEMHALDKFWSRLIKNKAAVRSSSAHEDSSNSSAAGIYETKLSITRETLMEAIIEVTESLKKTATGVVDDIKGGIVVQNLVQAEYAGIFFTEHPENPAHAMIEAAEGLGDRIVSGEVTPESFTFGKLSGQLIASSVKPILDFKKLIAAGRILETHFSAPQDIEWAYARGEFFPLQSRNITAVKPLSEEEKVRVISLSELAKVAASPKAIKPEATIFEENEMSELLPNPTPMSVSVMERVWGREGSVELGCEALGIGYAASEKRYLVKAFGRLFVNKQEESSRFSVLSALTLRPSRFDGLEEGLDSFKERQVQGFRLGRALNLSEMPLADLALAFKQTLNEFVTEKNVYTVQINIAADFLTKKAVLALEKSGVDNPQAYLIIDSPVSPMKFSAMLSKAKVDRSKTQDFVDMFGHRAEIDYELSSPRYSETLDALIAAAQPTQKAHKHTVSESVSQLSTKVAALVERAKLFQVLKEEVKHYTLLDFAVMRMILVEIGERLEIGSAVFNLTVDEIDFVATDSVLAKERALKRQKKEQYLSQSSDMPAQIRVVDIEGGLQEEAIVESGELSGKLIAGPGDVEGIAHILNDVKELEAITDPTVIAVIKNMGNTMTLQLNNIAGIVTETGGWLSHAAIIAREMNITYITAVKDAKNRVQHGSRIRLTKSGKIEILDANKEEA
jgi:phosphoenolpyruvate synthase/pyruvate phosphate dikinase/rhodanese-related sulfurtransferase/membrane protein insertase Oxa1/YidC/SpoIIIJ